MDNQIATTNQLKKHVNAIHSSNEISLLQRKLFNALTFVAYPNLLEQQLFEVPTKELCKLIGYKSNDIGKLRDALTDMMSTVVHWNVVTFDKRDNEKTLYWEASTMLAAARIKNGICTFEFSSMLKQRLYHPERYARLDMGVISKLKSKYGIALYENCIRFQGLKYTPWFDIEDFRTIMGANLLNDKGEVAERKYQDYRDFKKRVIDPGISEVNANTNLCLELEEERDIKQKIKQVRFKQYKDPVLVEELETICPDLSAIQKKFGVPIKALEKLELEYGLDVLKKQAEFVVNSRSYQTGKIKDLASYYISAVKENFEAPTGVETAQKEQLQEKQTRQQERLIRKHRSRIDSQYANYLTSQYTNYIQALSEESLASLKAAYVDLLAKEGSIRFVMYEKFGFGNMLVQDNFCAYVIDAHLKKEKIITSLQDFEKDYIARLHEMSL